MKSRPASRWRWLRALGLVLSGVVLGVLGGVALVLLFPIWERDESELGGVEQRAAALRWRRERFTALCATDASASFQAKASAWLDERRSLSERLPATPQLHKLLQDWQARAYADGVALSLVDVDKIRREFYLQVPISVELSGEGESVGRVLSEIDTAGRALSWQGLELRSAYGTRKTLRVQVDVYAVILRSVPEDCGVAPTPGAHFHFPLFARRWRARAERFEAACASLREVLPSPEQRACEENASAVRWTRPILKELDSARKPLPDLEWLYTP